MCHVEVPAPIGPTPRTAPRAPIEDRRAPCQAGRAGGRGGTRVLTAGGRADLRRSTDRAPQSFRSSYGRRRCCAQRRPSGLSRAKRRPIDGAGMPRLRPSDGSQGRLGPHGSPCGGQGPLRVGSTGPLHLHDRREEPSTQLLRKRGVSSQRQHVVRHAMRCHAMPGPARVATKRAQRDSPRCVTGRTEMVARTAQYPARLGILAPVRTDTEKSASCGSSASSSRCSTDRNSGRAHSSRVAGCSSTGNDLAGLCRSCPRIQRNATQCRPGRPPLQRSE